jgi:hypothetical protein
VTRSAGARRFGRSLSFGDFIFKSRPCRKELAQITVRKMHSFIGFADETIGNTLPKPLDRTK